MKTLQSLPGWNPCKLSLPILMLLSCCATLHVSAEAPDESASAPKLRLALEQADIKDFIRWAAAQTGKNIILHPAVKGKVTVLIGDGLTPQEAYGVFISTLQVHGLAIVERDKALKVVPANEATKQYAPVSEEGTTGYADDVVVRVLRTTHLPADQLVSLIQPLLTPSSFLQALPQSNVLVVGDRRGNIDRVLTLIHQIDRTGVSEVRSLPIKFADASEVASQIRQLLPELFSNVTGARLNLILDPRTNTLLASGPPPILDQLQGLSRQLDQPVLTSRLTKVVPIDYLDAKALVAPLMSVAKSLKTLRNEGEGRGEAISIDVSEANNALIITAPETTFSALQSVIHQLDVRRTQVLVEAIIVEVSAQKVLDFGINWSTDVPSNDGIFAAGGLAGDTNMPSPPAFGTGLSFGFFRNGDLRGLIRAIAGDSDTNFLSTPTLVTLDNHEAEILVGQNIPLITGSSTGAASSTNNPFQTIQRQDIGIALKVTPRVNNDGSMTLDVNQTVESVEPASVGATDIITSKREITTKVLIEDDEVLVLGGLIRDDLSQNVSKIPLLGDIPVVGQLFRSSSDEVVKRNLMVFIHPRILRSRGDNIEITHKYQHHINTERQSFLGRNNSFIFPSTLPQHPSMREREREREREDTTATDGQ